MLAVGQTARIHCHYDERLGSAMLRCSIIMLAFCVNIMAQGEYVIERVEIPMGNYAAGALDDSAMGRRLAEAYSAITKLSVELNPQVDTSMIEEMVKNAVYAGRADRRLDGGSPTAGIITFSDGYAANVSFYKFYLVIDGHYFIANK